MICKWGTSWALFIFDSVNKRIVDDGECTLAKLLDRVANKPIGDLSSNLPPQLYTFTSHQWPRYNKGKEATVW